MDIMLHVGSLNRVKRPKYLFLIGLFMMGLSVLMSLLSMQIAYLYLDDYSIVNSTSNDVLLLEPNLIPSNVVKLSLNLSNCRVIFLDADNLGRFSRGEKYHGEDIYDGMLKYTSSFGGFLILKSGDDNATYNFKLEFYDLYHPYRLLVFPSFFLSLIGIVVSYYGYQLLLADRLGR